MTILNDNTILYAKGTTVPYIEMLQEWSPITPGVWETKDLSVAPFNIPPGAVLEIAISNSTHGATDPAYSGGVRAVGSSIDRTIEIHPPEPSLRNYVIMHVQSNVESKIETFAESTTFNQFTLLGYWIEGQYVEIAGTLNVTTSNTWQGRDLTSFGVPNGAVVEILLGNKQTFLERSIGVRTSGSTVERRFNIHEAEDAGIDSLTLFTKTTNDNATIEIYSQSVSNVDFILLGYWSQPPMVEFIETNIDIGEPDANDIWILQDLSAFLPADINTRSVLEVAIGNGESVVGQRLGIRQSGTTIERFLSLHEAEAGGFDFVRMHTNLDGNKSIEFLEQNEFNNSDFIIAGYWQDGPAPIPSDSGNISLFINGPQPATSGLDLFVVGPIQVSSGMNLFTVGPLPFTSGLDLFIAGPILASGDMTLAGLRPSGFVGELDLFVAKKDLISDNITLLLVTPLPVSGSMNLYIANSGVPLSFTAFLKGGFNFAEDDIPLFMRGTNTSGSVFFQDGSVDLFLKTIGDPTDSPTTFDTSIFMRVASGFLDINNAWGLFLKSSTNLNKDLEMSITGTLGGTLVSGDVTLFMESLFDNDNWLLFLKTISGTQNTVDLFMSGVVADPITIQASSTLMTSGIGVPIAEIDLFLFNEPPSSSGSMTMFLATDPLVNEKSLILYTHGF